MLNRITLVGSITTKPELQYTIDGKPVVNFTLAVTREHNKQKTDYIDCCAWHGVAENIARNVTAGYILAVGGNLENRNKKTKEHGDDYFGSVVNCDRVVFVTPKGQATALTEKDSPAIMDSIDREAEVNAWDIF